MSYPVIYALAGLAGLVLTLREMWVRWSRAHWIRTEATILEEVPDQAFHRETGFFLRWNSASTPKYKVTYVYEVDGEDIVSSSIRRRSGVRWYLAGIPIDGKGRGGQTEGESITVYYNPDVPVRSTTEIHVGVMLYLGLALSFIVFTIGALWTVDGML